MSVSKKESSPLSNYIFPMQQDGWATDQRKFAQDVEKRAEQLAADFFSKSVETRRTTFLSVEVNNMPFFKKKLPQLLQNLREAIGQINFSRGYELACLQYPTVEEFKPVVDIMKQIIKSLKHCRKSLNKEQCRQVNGRFIAVFVPFLNKWTVHIREETLQSRHRKWNHSI